ncbi:hypothetical protein EYF80_008674 [Liparis tanakae]|uniref:Uncharacterized protein n=1 Tax=Liparis tanakae TaxID=230148 RepID=A0A4Z2ITV2_9TELE|nr:hypothetical protein EYF80_008674 [Liparis tanakae]
MSTSPKTFHYSFKTSPKSRDHVEFLDRRKGSRLCSEEGVGVPGSPEEGVGEAGSSSESEFSNERSSTSARRPRSASGSAARLTGREAESQFVLRRRSHFLFWALERELSSSTSSSCLFSCFRRTMDLSS